MYRRNNFSSEGAKAVTLLHENKKAEKIFQVMSRLQVAPFWMVVKQTNLSPDEVRANLWHLQDVGLIELETGDFDTEDLYSRLTSLAYAIR
jgi:hypothetical protein